MVVVEVRQDAAGGGVVLEVIEHPVHLVHVPLGIVVLHGQLIAVGLADGAGLVRPGVPDVGAEVVDIVGLFLPDPEQFIHGALEIHPADGLDRELFFEIVSVHKAEALDGVGGGAVLPAGANGLVRVPGALG